MKADIVTRLLAEVAWEPEVGELMTEAAGEIARLRGVICELHARESQRLQRTTLSDAERDAYLWSAKVHQIDLPDRT